MNDLHPIFAAALRPFAPPPAPAPVPQKAAS
jgi:hypothetical protein